ncbi:MAG: 3-isopropylmalate/(R)-2-methylmalate dehydratase small subunit [Desulfonauticus sp.]|jgi:3-isopropylmalate/(R)-2-methylmalate dehydratase small subunit|nr:MAG: 3-isopropylmalate dehydratase small subunit [Desulfonauticus sp. 38_4375]MDK2921115.1 3-isopropylmalate/(R)-2-methylmalate dehydratase small subunit [Desulfonauticus sp.]
MIFQGKAHKVGDHIDTDAIIPARFLVTTDPEELGKHCLSGLEENFIQKVAKGDILVGGKNFGCGSSREHAPLAILGAGIPVVIAHSFARIFYRNGFNMGLLLLEVGEEVEKISEGDELKIDTQRGEIEIVNKQLKIKVNPVPEFMQKIINAGGLINFAQARIKGA